MTANPSTVRPLVRLLALALVVALAPAAWAARPWLADTVVYGVVPRNFGGAAAIVRRLDHLRDLGVGALWLAPLTATPPGDYGYAVTDYFGLRDDFGTPEELQTLVREAHRRGLRVLLDFVPNHTSVEHPWFKDARARGPASPTWDFYDRDAKGEPTHYFDWEHLPNLNYANPAVQATMIEAFAHWVRTYDLDGFRIDAAWGVQDRAPAFWPRLVRELRAIKPDLAFIAEANARDRYWADSGFDAAYDWGDQLGQWAWNEVWNDPNKLVERLDAALAREPAVPPLRFLNNNDTGTRFLARHGVAMTRAAVALTLTLPGVPLVFTGDEVGAAFHPYEDGARTIAWRDRHGLTAEYRRLIALRRALPSLRSGALERLPVRAGETSYAFVRSAPGERPVLVVLGFTGATDARVELPAAWRRRFPTVPRAVHVPARGYRVFVGVP